jgi:hypothetical protein
VEERGAFENRALEVKRKLTNYLGFRSLFGGRVPYIAQKAFALTLTFEIYSSFKVRRKRAERNIGPLGYKIFTDSFWFGGIAGGYVNAFVDSSIVKRSKMQVFGSSAVRHFVYYGILFGVFDYMLGCVLPPKKNSQRHSLLSYIGAAFIAENLASIAEQPFRTIHAKVIGDTESRSFLGVKTFVSETWARSGIRGFFLARRGPPIRANLFALVFFAEMRSFRNQ